jgi:hypothetical protein
MELKSDEVRLRELFDQMTLGQPEAPPDRHGGIRRRARRHRIMKGTGALAAGAAVAALAVGIATTASGVPPASGPRHGPIWALPWPDHRNGSVPQRVLDGAITAWRHQTGVPQDLTAPSKVIWYVGQTVAHGQAVAVIFEVDSQAGRRLVAGWATASEVMNGQPAWTDGSSPWVLFDVAAPRAAQGLLIGLNTHGTTTRPGRNPDNWVVLLAGPTVQSVSFTAPGPISPNSGSGVVGAGRLNRGLAVADVGEITGPVEVNQLNVGRRNLLDHPVTVGVPGSVASQVPQLALPGPVPGRPGFQMSTGISGQGTSSLGTDLSRRHGRLAIRARCYGPSRLRIMYEGRGRPTLLGTMPCDDAVHELIASVRAGAHVFVTVHTGSLTAYRVVLGTVR